MSDLSSYPVELKGGYYDGAMLIGTRNEGRCAEYYNPSSHGVVQYRYIPSKGVLEADFDPERSLQSGKTVVDHIRDTETRNEGYDELSPWAREKLKSTF